MEVWVGPTGAYGARYRGSLVAVSINEFSMAFCCAFWVVGVGSLRSLFLTISRLPLN